MRTHAQGMRFHLGSAIAVIAVLCACGGTSSVVGTATSTSIKAPLPTATPAAVASVLGVSGANTAVTADYGSTTASCQGSDVLVSGGYLATYDSSPTGFEPAPTESYPLNATTWKVTIRTLGNASHVTAIAVCLHANFPVTIQIAHAAATGSNASVACPAGTVLTGGGFQSATAPVVFSQPSGNGWKVEQQFINQGDANPTAYALCASQGLQAGSVQQGTAAIAAGHTGNTSVPCPSGQLPVGGGFNGFPNSVDVNWEVSHSVPNLATPGSDVSSGWAAAAYNGEQSSEGFIAYAVCDTH